MPTFKAPLRDIAFAMNEVLDFPDHYANLPAAGEVAEEIVTAVLEEFARFSENIIAPLNQTGDQQGCKWQGGTVTTPSGFKEAYQQFVDNGWHSLSCSPSFGGQGLPASLNTICYEMQSAANHAWSMYNCLTAGAIKTIQAHASEKLRQRFLPNLVTGTWSGTMCLTEAHSGSDLGLLHTKATPNDDGSYKISGTKIFISSGEHDLTENIIHVVLARLPDAPEGVKGISLFIVPKIQVKDDQSLGNPNHVNCGSIEHKMGIHGNATCVMNFDGATGYLIGPPNKGMSCMFTFINESRLQVAQQGQAHIAASFQTAANYAQGRLQMRAPVRQLPEQPADPIIVHPDVKRMLLTQKALAEGGRLLNYFCAQQIDIEQHSNDQNQRSNAETLLALLTPIAKGFLTEASIEATNNGIQVLGGHGYIHEWGQEQHFRDTRITAIYEGTNGIQGLDLLGRKILASGGSILRPFEAMVRQLVSENPENIHAIATEKAFQRWLTLTKEIETKAKQDANEINAAAYDYLMLAGYTVLAYFWAKSAITAEHAASQKPDSAQFYQAKLATAQFYFERMLPRCDTLAACIRSGADNLTQVNDTAFTF